jgi:hypothetical protein
MIARFIPFNPLGEFRNSLAPDISRATHAEHRAVNGWAKAPPQAEQDEDRRLNGTIPNAAVRRAIRRW